MTKRRIVRQGDVLLRQLMDDEVPAGELTPAPRDARGLVLAEGETSGHHHQVFGRGAKLFQFRDPTGSRVLTVGESGAEVRVVGGGVGGVPRHLPVTLAPGRYEVRLQRQYTAEEALRHRVMED